MNMADQAPYPGMPRWVKVSGIILCLMILLAVIVAVSGIGGPHGPSRHLPPAGTGSKASSTSGRP